MQFLQGIWAPSLNYNFYISVWIFIILQWSIFFLQKTCNLDILFLNSKGGICVAKYGNPASQGFFLFCFSNYLIPPIVRSQTLLAQNNERGCINSSGIESQAAKRQKLEGGHLFKVLSFLFPVLVPLVFTYILTNLSWKFYILNKLNSLMSFSKETCLLDVILLSSPANQELLNEFHSFNENVVC